VRGGPFFRNFPPPAITDFVAIGSARNRVGTAGLPSSRSSLSLRPTRDHGVGEAHPPTEQPHLPARAGHYDDRRRRLDAALDVLDGEPQVDFPALLAALWEARESRMEAMREGREIDFRRKISDHNRLIDDLRHRLLQAEESYLETSRRSLHSLRRVGVCSSKARPCAPPVTYATQQTSSEGPGVEDRHVPRCQRSRDLCPIVGPRVAVDLGPLSRRKNGPLH
jgi:hypothetical protein